MIEYIFVPLCFIFLYRMLYILKRYNKMVLKYEQEITDLKNQGNHINLDNLNDPYYELRIHQW